MIPRTRSDSLWSNGLSGHWEVDDFLGEKTWSPISVCYPSTAIRYPTTGVGHPPTAVGYPPTTAGCSATATRLCA